MLSICLILDLIIVGIEKMLYFVAMANDPSVQYNHSAGFIDIDDGYAVFDVLLQKPSLKFYHFHYLDQAVQVTTTGFFCFFACII